MLVLNNDGFLLTVREFVEWEYNGGRGDFQPDTTFRTWNSLPVDAKIGYVACSVYGDVVGESSLLIKVGNKLICYIMLRTRRKVWKQLTNTCMHCIAKQRVCSKARQRHRSTKHL